MTTSSTRCPFKREREQLLLFLRFRLFRDWTDHKGNVEQLGPRGAGFVIGNDDGDVDLQLVALMPLKQISQAVILFGDERSDPRTMGGPMDLEPHLQDLCDRGECPRNVLWRNLESVRGKLLPHQKIVDLFARVVIRIENVASEVVNEPGDAGHDALAVFTQQNLVYSI